ncbi:MAG: T9SS type A sorting domain-containing protein [Bacteroidetes bacterium]|nr:T9SS type A sorting domain-containing protein [Bacteroidota bacterium]
MKRSIFFIISLFWITSLFSQIIVNESDMPVAGDTLRVSITNVVPAGFAKTAMDTAWNFALLQALTQRVDTFVGAGSTPALYQFFFVLQGGANLASPRSALPIPGLPVSQGFTFFKNSATSYSDLGSAYTIQGLPLPAKYDVPDKQYQFPMTPGLAWSSNSTFAITLPGMGSYSTQRNRSNIVDGWGALTTPYGTFQTMRVKSTLAIHDSIYLDSVGTGFSVNRNVTEYKWLAKGKGIPVLEISEEQNLVTATYRDIYRMPAQALSVSLGPDTAVLQGTVLTLHASVSGGTPPFQVVWSTMDTGSALTVTVQDITTYSVFVMDALQNFGTGRKVVSIKYPPGIEEYPAAQLNCYPNPTTGRVHFTLPGNNTTAAMQVFTPQGKVACSRTIVPASGEQSVDLSGLPDGMYFLRITTTGYSLSVKINIIK